MNIKLNPPKDNFLKKDCKQVYPIPKPGKNPIQVRALEAAQEHFDRSTPEGRYILARLEVKAAHATKRAAKPKKTEWQKVRDKADTTFQKYIRMRDTLMVGTIRSTVFKCCTCGQVKHTSHLQAGHCIERRSKGSMGTRWEEANAHGQCDWCNNPAKGGGRRKEHETFIVAKYGKEKLLKLKLKQLVDCKKPTIPFMEEIIKKYQSKIDEL